MHVYQISENKEFGLRFKKAREGVRGFDGATLRTKNDIGFPAMILVENPPVKQNGERVYAKFSAQNGIVKNADELLQYIENWQATPIETYAEYMLRTEGFVPETA